jgi:hypothetical protein
MTFSMNNEHPKLWLEELQKKKERSAKLRVALEEALSCLTSVAHVEVHSNRVVSFDMEKYWQREVSLLRAALADLED